MRENTLNGIALAKIFFTAPAILCALVLCAGGCARTQMQKILPNVSNMQLARAYFGNPTDSEALADGGARHEWVLDRLFTHPGGTQIVYIYVGHDRDGYREYVAREIDVPPRVEAQYCRLTIVADKEGRVLRSSWEGRHCDELPILRVAD